MAAKLMSYTDTYSSITPTLDSNHDGVIHDKRGREGEGARDWCTTTEEKRSMRGGRKKKIDYSSGQLQDVDWE